MFQLDGAEQMAEQLFGGARSHGKNKEKGKEDKGGKTE